MNEYLAIDSRKQLCSSGLRALIQIYFLQLPSPTDDIINNIQHFTNQM